MAYFLGRDIDIAITTEHPTQGVVVKGWSDTALKDKLLAGVVSYAENDSTSEIIVSADDKSKAFAGPRAMSKGAGLTTNDAFGDLTGDGTTLKDVAWDNQPNNLTAIDVSLSVQDEDVAFIGQRNILKAEVKKENTISLTRKKSDGMWDAIYNDARFGIKESNTVAAPTADAPLPGLFTGLSAPDYVTCGYRVVMRFSDGVSNIDANSPTTDSGQLINGSMTASDPYVDTDLADSESDFVVGDYIKLDSEILKITANSSNDASRIYFDRGVRGTTAAAHDDNKEIYHLTGAGETLVFRNCYITEHGVSLQVDGSQEETLTLTSYVDPKIFDGTFSDWDGPTTLTEL